MSYYLDKFENLKSIDGLLNLDKKAKITIKLSQYHINIFNITIQKLYKTTPSLGTSSNKSSTHSYLFLGSPQRTL